MKVDWIYKRYQHKRTYNWQAEETILTGSGASSTIEKGLLFTSTHKRKPYPEKSGLGKDHSRNGNHIIKTLKNYSKCEEEKCETCMYMACVVQQICLTITPGWMPGLIKISLLPVNAIIKDNGSEIYTTLKKPNIANAAPITIYNEHTWYLSFFYTHTF